MGRRLRKKNVLRDATRSRFCELYLGKSASIPGTPEVVFESVEGSIDGLIRREMHEFAQKGSLLYKAPTSSELLHIDRYLLRPLFELSKEGFDRDMGRIARNAQFYGYKGHGSRG